MSIFGNILNRIFQSNTSAADSTSRQPTTGATTHTSSSTSDGGQSSLKNVDVQAVLSQLASQKDGGGNWRTSVVDLLKLLDLDSSLAARKALAQELNVHAGADGSAEQNIALQKAVMNKIAENGGKVPESLRN